MTGHDPRCPVDPPRMDDSYCFWCEVIARVRADEREQIAQAIESAESLAADFTWQGRAFTMGYEGARGLAARIARRGGNL